MRNIKHSKTYHFGCWLAASMACFSFNANQKGIFLQKIQNIEFHINNLGDNIKTAVNDIRMNLLTSLLSDSFTHSITYPPTHSCTYSLTQSNPAPHVTLNVCQSYMDGQGVPCKI